MLKHPSFQGKFSRKPSSLLSNQPDQIWFMLDTDLHGVYLSVVDKKRKPITPDYQLYQGAERILLRAMNQVEARSAFVIDWEKPADRIYLHEHDYLLDYLRSVPNVIDASGEPLSFAEGMARLQLFIEEKNEQQYRSWIRLRHKGMYVDGVTVVSERYVWYEQKLYEVPPLGESAIDLHVFQTEFEAADLNQFLSLLFSYIKRIDLQYRDYQLQFEEEPVQARPCLIFEQVDEDQALHLRVTQQLPGMGFEFLEQYELFRLAETNDMTRRVVVRPIQQWAIGQLVEEVQQHLHSAAPSAKARKEVILDGNVFIIPPHTAGPFLYQKLPVLLDTYTLYGAEKLKHYKVKAYQPRLDLRLNSGIDFFEGEALLDFEGERISLLDALRQYQQQHYIQLSDGTHAILKPDYLKKIERIFRKGKGKNKVKLSFFDLPFVEGLIDEKIAQANFEASRKIFEGFNHIKSSKVRLPKINATLRPYQKDGYKWLRYLYQHQLGGCLADDMGLGKTLQTIAMLATVYPGEKTPSLVVMPRTLLFNWYNEVRKFKPELKTYTYYGLKRDLQEALQAQVIFTTYGTLRNDIEQFKELAFHFVVLDESQHIKNYQSQTAKAVMLLQAKHRLALSGTPIENNLGELYSLFRFLNPAMFGSVQEFNRHYATPIQKENDREAISELRLKIYPFILRRLKQEVLKELPDKIEQVLYVEMSPKQKKLYEQRRAFYRGLIQSEIKEKGIKKSQFLILQGLSELRQLATVPEAKTDGKIASPKLEILESQLAEAVANGHKVLIFSNFLTGIETIGETLDKLGIDYVSMTGATRNRQYLVDRFQEDPSCKAFLMTLKTGGLGLNLTAADTIFIYDPWWNLAAETQAIDRAHRMGQTQKVTSYKIITRDSIEEKILLLQEKKKALFEDIITSDSATLKSLSESDIEFMLGS
ncbi:MAG: DEAD/DEAH box helicase [Bacteroidetes bacterium]|nr:MAG: DEAD/DEAH box helicase [Bacteroidota bacterium]